MTKRKNSLEGILDRSLLRRMAGARSFERGEGYFAGNRVGAVVDRAGVITATVQGTQSYRVKLWLDAGAVEYSCSCPVGQDGEFCKHSVALGLALLSGQSAKKSVATKPRPQITLDDVRAQLLKRDKNSLVEVILQQAALDDGLRRRLLMETASRAAGPLDVETYRHAIDDAVDSEGFVDYREARVYAEGIDAAIDGIETLLRQGHATEVIELTEHALAAIERVIGSVDDSDGDMGTLVERIQALHLRACQKAKPDPKALARRLFDWELRSEWDSFHGAADTYADVFGKQGLAQYRQLAEAEWAKQPVLQPGNDDTDKYGHRFRITRIMTALTRQSGDIEALVAIKQRDLSLPYHYLEVAEIYKEACKQDQALDWAERGVKAFPGRMDQRLLEFVANAYHQRRRHADAMRLIWAAFCELVTVKTYQDLMAHAQRSGQHDVWRERALLHIRQAIVKQTRSRSRNEWNTAPADHSLLVRILIWEKKLEQAWEEASGGGCSEALWLELAAARERSHPADALKIYRRQIEPTLNRTSPDAYRQAIATLRKVRTLLRRLKRDDEFAVLLSELRLTWKRKRNFMTMLDHARW